MGTQGFVRRTRVPRTADARRRGQPAGTAEVPRVVPGNLFMRLLPVVMVVAVIGMIALMFSVGGRAMASTR